MNEDFFLRSGYELVAIRCALEGFKAGTKDKAQKIFFNELINDIKQIENRNIAALRDVVKVKTEAAE